MKTKYVATAVVVILVGFGIYKLYSNSEKKRFDLEIQAAKLKKIPVKIAKVGYKSANQTIEYSGTFEAQRELNIQSLASGRIIDILVDQGSVVSENQLLAKVKKDGFEIEHIKAKKNYQNAKEDNARFESAFKSGGVTKQQLEQSRLRLEIAKSSLDQTELGLSETNIRSSIQGIISKKFIELGSIVSPGIPLFQVVDISKLKLNLKINDSDISHINLGDSVEIELNNKATSKYKGVVGFISPITNGALSYPVLVEVNNKDMHLKAGMYATAKFKKDQSNRVLVVPTKAFLQGISSKQLYQVLENQTARLINVEVGEQIDTDYIEILSGLKEDDQIVVEGQINLFDGANIEIQSENPIKA